MKVNAIMIALPLSLATQTVMADCSTVAECAQEAVEAAQAAQEALRLAAPSGAVMAFDRDTCPPGWSEYANAQGRFIRGIDKTGSRRDPDGKRAPGAYQPDSIAAHNHQVSISRADTQIVGRGILPYFEPRNNFPAVRSSMEGGDETRPKNIALLFCKRD